MKTRIKTALSAVITAVIAALATAASAVPSITVDSVVQRWPWNNKVDITYKVGNGQDVSANQYYKIVFTTVIDGQTYTIDGSTISGASANTGTHTVTWTLPDGVLSTNCTMSAALYTADAPSGDDYMVVQLTGENAGTVTYEGLLATQAASNERYNTDTYKTDKLVLRKVPAGGTYRTGGKGAANGSNYNNNQPHDWTTDRNYYIGVFPVTQSQYNTIYGSNPSYYKTDAEGNPAAQRPVEKVSWFGLRSVAGDTTMTPTTSIPAVTSDTVASGNFFQKLNYMTGRYFDLPTEVMFEIAQRANRTTVYSWGDEEADYVDYAVTMTNTTLAVGSRLPNDWGLYDTAGNVQEWCLDNYAGTLQSRSDAFTPGWDPDSNSGRRMARGTPTWDGNTTQRPASFRQTSGLPATTENQYNGFRVAIIEDN